MQHSVFSLFKIGIGPSSSHTMGPMGAARHFVAGLAAAGRLAMTARVRCELFGSLAATGVGHGTDRAVLLGLMGCEAESVDVGAIEGMLDEVGQKRRLRLMGRHEIGFDPTADLLFRPRETRPRHPNALQLTACDAGGSVLAEALYYSIGGGAVIDAEGREVAGGEAAPTTPLELPFANSAGLLGLCAERGLTIAEVMRRNEHAWRDDAAIDARLARIWEAMQACVERGLATEGTLPGRLHVRRRAAGLFAALTARPEPVLNDPMQVIDWVNLYALAVNEENAAGGRVVTAPTNGAAGIVPAVLHYYARFVPHSAPGAEARGVAEFLLTAGAVGLLYKENASISGAEVGCQGEVGVACSMAAAGLCAVLGGTPAQVENAAEIAMEHHLGLTCDPVGGLVQIPCIERNAVASVEAITATRMALRGDGRHFVSLDQVIATMRATGADMMSKYKETARGGLAVAIVEC